MALDIKTLMIMNLLINVVGSLAMAIIWKQNKNRFTGIGFWLADMLMQAIGSLLIILRGIIPNFFSIVIANTLIILGVVLLYTGMSKFIEKKVRNMQNYFLIVLGFFALSYYTYIQFDLNMRTTINATMLLIVTLQIAWLLLKKVDANLFKSTWITGLIFCSYALVNLLEINKLLFFPSRENDFFKASLFESLKVLSFATLSALLTITLVLMVNKRLLIVLREKEQQFSVAFHSSPYAIILTKIENGMIFEVNEGFVKLTGYQYSEVLGKTTLALKLWEREEDRIAVVKDLLEHEEVQEIECNFRTKAGKIINGLFSSKIITINGEKCILSNISDITNISNMKQQLQVMATHDALTELPNRILFYDRLAIALANARRNRKGIAILSLDLDRFKDINDSLGHDTGDKVLQAAAKKLTGVVRSVDTVARFGGDEFVVLLGEIELKADVEGVLQKILGSFRESLKVNGVDLILTVSIGVALYPTDDYDINALIKNQMKLCILLKPTVEIIANFMMI